jgi:hypothetical protein
MLWNDEIDTMTEITTSVNSFTKITGTVLVDTVMVTGCHHKRNGLKEAQVAAQYRSWNY